MLYVVARLSAVLYPLRAFLIKEAVYGKKRRCACGVVWELCAKCGEWLLCGYSVPSAVSGWSMCVCGCGRVALCRACVIPAPASAAHRPCQQHVQERVAGGVGVLLHAQQPVTVEVVLDTLRGDGLVCERSAVVEVCARLGMEVH